MSVPKNLVINVWAFEVLIMLAIPFVVRFDIST